MSVGAMYKYYKFVIICRRQREMAQLVGNKIRAARKGKGNVIHK